MTGLSRTTGLALDSGGDAYLEQSIGDVLTTPIGSRVMRRDYGAVLTDLIDQPFTAALRLRIFAGAALAVMRWVPIARLQQLQLVPRAGGAPGAFDLRVQGVRRDRPQGRNTFDLLIPLRPASGPILA